MAELRIGDADREAAVHLLGEQYAVGRLTKEEFDERSDAAWSARTGSDLAPLFADLPVVSPGRPGPPAPRDARPGQWRPGIPVPWVPLLFVLVGLTVLTHLPFVLIAVGLWFLLGRRRWHGGPWVSNRAGNGRDAGRSRY